jgi:hypothetical protein
MATLEIGAPVEAADGRFGRLESLVLDPATHAVEELVVQDDSSSPGYGRGEHRLVPASHVVEAADGGIRLDLGVRQLRDCETFDESRYRGVGPDEWVLKTAELPDATEPLPEWPREAHVPMPDLPISKIEPAYLLANDARGRLRDDGFTDREINAWSRAYFAVHHEGDVDDLIEWIEEQERLDAEQQTRAAALSGDRTSAEPAAATATPPGQGVGRRRWAITGETGPDGSPTDEREVMTILNTCDRTASVSLVVYFAHRDPAGPYRLSVGAHRLAHVRLNELHEPERLPAGVRYSAVVESDCPVVVHAGDDDSDQTGRRRPGAWGE